MATVWRVTTNELGQASLRVSPSQLGAAGAFWNVYAGPPVPAGNVLQTIDMIVDMGHGREVPWFVGSEAREPPERDRRGRKIRWD